MTTHNLQSIVVGSEASFGSIDSATGLPDQATVTWAQGGPFMRAALLTQDQPTLDFDIARDGYWRLRREPETVINRSGVAAYGANDGEYIARYMGEIVLESPVWSIGTGTGTITSYDGHAMSLAWLSSLNTTTPVDNQDACAAVGTTNTFTATDAAEWRTGDGLAWLYQGVVNYGLVTGIAGAVVTYSPSSTAAIPQTTSIRHCYTLFPDATNGPQISVAVRMNLQGRRLVAFGCRAREIVFDFRRNGGESTGGTLWQRTTLVPAVILRDDTNAAVVNSTRPAGRACQWRQAYHLTTASVIGSTTPASLGRSSLSLRDWSATLSFDLAPTGGGSANILGRGNTEVADASIELRLRSEPNGILRDMMRLREERLFLLGCGPAPTTSPVGLNAHGFALAVMAGNAEGSKIENDEGRQIETVVIRPGRWALDTAGGDAANSPFRILLPY